MVLGMSITIQATFCAKTQLNFIIESPLRSIAIIAEGIPENMTRQLINVAEEKKVNIIGPATVGGIKPGCFKIGNTGGMMDNILHSKLYRHENLHEKFISETLSNAVLCDL